MSMLTLLLCVLRMSSVHTDSTQSMGANPPSLKWSVCTMLLTCILCPGYQDILRTNGVVDKRLDVWQRAVDTQRFNPKCACEPLD